MLLVINTNEWHYFTNSRNTFYEKSSFVSKTPSLACVRNRPGLRKQACCGTSRLLSRLHELLGSLKNDANNRPDGIDLLKPPRFRPLL